MKNLKYSIALLSILLALVGCGDKEKQVVENNTEKNSASQNEVEVTKAQFNANKMALGTFTNQIFPTVVNTSGMIDVPPENRAIVNATMGGYIKTTPLLIGDKVKKGQVLVTIENAEFVTLQQEYLEIKEQLNYLKAEFERQKRMVEENITSQKSSLKAESEYKTALAKQSGLKKQLEMLNISITNVAKGIFNSIATIYSPISGSITKVNVNRGTYVSPATAILEIIDNDHLHIEFSVFEKDILNIKKDQKITFKIPEISNNQYDGEVHLVGTSIDANRTIKVHAHIEDESKFNFLTGMFVEGAIITDEYSSLAIPTEAIVNIENTSYVLVLDPLKDDMYSFKQIEVMVKASYKGYSIINSTTSFKGDEEFLIKGVFGIIGE